ncbi:MAG: hypothetical protein RRC34_13045 [Lentisphaeria bacterium]|nr:hypothetical protein [Lentisphaeria bacterium]
MKKIAMIVFAGMMVFGTYAARGAELSGDTTVYYGSGKRCHVVGCSRLTKDPDELAKMTKMTLAEAEKRGLPPCSKCPVGAVTPKSGSAASTEAAPGISGDIEVYYDGKGKRCHRDGCRRLTDEMKKTHKKMTLAEAGVPLCSRCPGSTTPGKGNPDGGKKNEESQKAADGSSKYGRKGAKARKSWLEIPAKEYDPNTKAYCDVLWMRVHEENCPMLLLKDRKKVITLEQADKEGWRIGESGQSGRSRCCFQGYRRKYPEKEFTEDTPGIAQYMKDGTRLKWHQAGCHRFLVSPDNFIMTQKEAKAYAEDKGLELFYVCEHCIERGPSVTKVDMEALKRMPIPPAFTPPEGWAPKAFSYDQLPSKEEIDGLIQETLATNYGILETPFEDPLASLEQFMGMRFFFPVGQWLTYYQAYRATGDKRLLDALYVSARHYHKRCVEYPDVAQLKAGDPEGMAFMYSMAVSARITLQLARKGEASQEEIDEAEGFLKGIVSTLKPTCEGNEDLDPEMGIPKPLADDFRGRAFNRASNGVGTIATAAAALEDLQALKKTKAYQPTIDRYRKCVQEWYKNWKKIGCLYTEADGKKYFYYPYAAGGNTKRENGLLLGGADDVGHYSISMQGVMLVHEATPELGADDEFMTAIANAVYHNSYTKNGSIQCPSADKINPLSRHPWNPNPKNQFYMFEAFRDGVIDGQFSKLSEAKKEATLSEYSHRLKTLHAQYMKALRQDRSLIHLGERQER